MAVENYEDLTREVVGAATNTASELYAECNYMNKS